MFEIQRMQAYYEQCLISPKYGKYTSESCDSICEICLICGVTSGQVQQVCRSKIGVECAADVIKTLFMVTRGKCLMQTKNF